MRVRFIPTALLVALAGRSADAQTGAPNRPVVRWPEAVGFVALAGTAFLSDEAIRWTIQGHNTGFRNSVAYVGNAFGNPKYVLAALAISTAGARLAGWDGVFDPGWRALQTQVVAVGSTMVLKSLIGRRRPEVSPDDPYRFNPVSFSYNSLPSGHTTTAFALATSLALETNSIPLDVVLYGLATTTAFARMHVDKHWASDTVVGAAIGILAARLVHRRQRAGDSNSATLARRGPGVTLGMSFSF